MDRFELFVSSNSEENIYGFNFNKNDEYFSCNTEEELSKVINNIKRTNEFSIDNLKVSDYKVPGIEYPAYTWVK